MGTLKVGRVGLDVTLDDPNAWSASRGITSASDTISGFLKTTTIAQRNALMTELLGQVGKTVPIVYSADSSLDGYYLLTGANVARNASDRPNSTSGLYRFSLNVDYLGSYSQVEFQSLVTGTVLTNDHGVTEGESQPFHAVPDTTVTYDSGSGTPTGGSRTSEDGTVPFFYNVSFADDPTWSVPPGSFYNSAAEIWTDSRLRAGRDYPDATAVNDFKLTNGIIRVTPETSGGASAGGLIFECYDGAWSSSTQFDIYFNATTKIPEWHVLTILKNDPHVCRIRLVRDADEAPPTSFRHILDLELRRGAHHVSCFYTWTGGNQNIQVRRSATDAASAVTPTGASSSVGIIDGANDGDGNRWILATPHTHTQDTTEGRITRSTNTKMGFMVGFEITGSSASTPDDAGDVMLQYLGHLSEAVRAVRR